MSEVKHTMLSGDERPICQIVVNADYQCVITVGRHDVSKITVAEETGEMNYIPWFEVWKGEALYSRVNSKYVSEVLYLEGQPKAKGSKSDA